MGLFNKIFGSKKTSKKGTTNYKLISSSNNFFSPFIGDMWQNDIVRSCIRPKSDAIGKLNPKHIEGTGEDMKINKNPRIRRILQNPNPHMSMQDFLMKMVIHRELHHNAFAYIQREKGKIKGVYPIPPSTVELLEFQKELYLKFHFYRIGKFITVPYQDVIHLRKDFNSNDIFGDNDYEAVKDLMEVITNTDKSVINAIKNGGIIRWLLEFKQTIRPEDKQIELEKFVDNYLSIENEVGAAATDPKYDAEQVEPNDFVPNAKQMEKTKARIYDFFGTNEKIVQSKYDEETWNSYFESEIEPLAKQMSEEFTRKLFSRRERGFGNEIIFSSKSLHYASMKTKIGLADMVDRGAMTANEWRKVMNLPPIEGGDEVIRRLDTAPVEDGGDED